ncbi:MAG TPA: Nif3-like dinuclear metal center hexameric protein [Chthoniobacterales bacterium]|jgi:dinuclear metal center YbgI/SA1388 family protein|nr:Nif3-like dinuclear metal center hexameric protein [Chthoniobacterales bacterium]
MNKEEAALQDVVSFANKLLEVAEIEDYPGAVNGLQLENRGTVSKIGAAVDASSRTIEMAISQRVDLLVIHHGIFWGGVSPVTGPVYRRLAKAMEADLAIYSAHLPLDFHPEIGNNVLLADALGLTPVSPFWFIKGRAQGYLSTAGLELSELVVRAERVLGRKIWYCPAGPSRARRIGIVTGGAGSHLVEVAAEGVDTFVTGEGPHHTFVLAEELGINLLYGGHYATETFGVKALAARLAEKFSLPWTFLDHPSEL